MKDDKTVFNILASIEKHIEALKPLLPKQTIVCVGEYPIKTLLKQPTVSREGTLPIFIEKSSDDIYKWIPKGYDAHLVLGFEDADIDTHFWYHVLPTIAKDKSVIESLKKRSAERLRGAIVFASVWDGVGSAAVPSLIKKFNKQHIDTLSIAVLPSKIQPADAHFNAYATMQMCLSTEGSTVLLLDRDQLETFEGVDKKGEQIKGNSVVNYMLNLFLAKESLVQEISELSRTFNVKLFGAVAVTAASYRVFGSLENMLNTALLKPLSKFDLSTSSLLYVLLRMPASLKYKIPRTQIELAITNWFKEKTNPQSVHITEPIYTEDMTDRIDAVLFIGGFDTAKMFADWEEKVSALKSKAVERGLMTEDWQLPFKNEEEIEVPEEPATQELAQSSPAEAPQFSAVEEPQTIAEALVPLPEVETATLSIENTTEIADIEAPETTAAPPEPAELPKPEKPKRSRRTKKAEIKTEKSQLVEEQSPEKQKRTHRTRKTQTEQKAE